MAAVIADRFRQFIDRHAALTKRAPERFAARDWHGLQRDAAERFDAYGDAVASAVEEIERIAGDEARSRDLWVAVRASYSEAIEGRVDAQIAETFSNSITRRLLVTVGTDAAVEYLEAIPLPPFGTAPVQWFDVDGDLEATLERAVTAPHPELSWQNLRRDIRLAAAELRRSVGLHGLADPVARIELLAPVFYRGQGAYLVGRFRTGTTILPLAIALHHTSRGLVIGAVLAETTDLSVLFSYTRSSFFVDTEHQASIVAYLSHLVPARSRDELYTAIGHRKHGKTELFRSFIRYVGSSSDRFEHARGIRGMVMIVFTVPGYDVVFKIIRDRFPFPKQTTHRQIMSKYRLVSRHDRAGRLVDAHEFEHLTFPRHRFTESLLDELAADATRSVTIDDDTVTLHHVYLERRLVPLDLYLREANPVKARAAIIDYGRAIKNLAAAGIFPGDMLLKNFGVTRSGRVVFYDYDEIIPLVDCNFRELPDSDRPDEEMAADPWFGVGAADVFPEEFTRFLGIRGELREAFDYHHADLFGVRFWTRMQDRLTAGEVIEIFPYKRSRRLGAGTRRTAALVD